MRDTNVAVSGLLWGGGCGEFFTLAELERVKLFTSDALLLELADVLPRRKLARRLVKRGVSAEEVLGSYRASCSVLTNVPVIKLSPAIRMTTSRSRVPRLRVQTCWSLATACCFTSVRTPA